VAAAELHIENVRDRAVAALDGLSLTLAPDGAAEGARVGPEGGAAAVSFTIRASPADRDQARRLVELCPPDDGGCGGNAGSAGGGRTAVRQLVFPDGTALTVRRGEEGGGTGTDPWRGGLLLAQHIWAWIGGAAVAPAGGLSAGTLFRDRHVVELGAGSACLPSMALAAACSHGEGVDLRPRTLVASDGVDETVSAMRRNVAENRLDNFVRVEHIDWNRLPAKKDDTNFVLADTIMFADCVYNEEGASALYDAIQTMLKPGGNVIGVLPDFRVGLDSFEKAMKSGGFCPTIIPRMEKESLIGPNSGKHSAEKFLCSGGGGKHYRLLWWRDCRAQ